MTLAIRDPVPVFTLFAQRYRIGALATGRHAVRARTVEDAVRAVGQAYARMGAPDPRLNAHCDVDFCLTSLYQLWHKDDAPPQRVKPLPLPVIAQVWALAQLEATPVAIAAAEILVISYYFLLRPGEYVGVPRLCGLLFRIQDVQLWIGSRALALLTCPDADILASTFVTLTFTTQKNGVRNETIGHGRSGHSHLCPVHCVASRLLGLRRNFATLETTIDAVRPDPTAPFSHVLASNLTR